MGNIARELQSNEPTLVSSGGIALPESAREWNAERETVETLELGEQLVKKYPDAFHRIQIEDKSYIVSEPQKVNGVNYAAYRDNQIDSDIAPGYAEITTMVVLTPSGTFVNISLAPSDSDNPSLLKNLFKGNHESANVIGFLEAIGKAQLLTTYCPDRNRSSQQIRIEPVLFDENSYSLDPFRKILEGAKKYSREQRFTRVGTTLAAELLN